MCGTLQPLTQITFQSVLSVLKIFGVDAIAEPTKYVLSSNSFSIRIAPSCSGVEGFALTTLFFVSYFYAFKEHLRFPNVWVLLPIGLLVSWSLNVLRIAALFLIGTNGNPELAVDGFHSHAGWLTFSILAFAMIGVTMSVPWFRRGNTGHTTVAGRLDGSSHIAICRVHGRGATDLHIHCDARSLVLRKGSRDLVCAGDLLTALSRAPGLANRHIRCGGWRCNRVALDCFRF